MSYAFTRGRFNVHYLTAPYELIAKALGDDGLTAPRDEDKVNAQWDLPEAEVYDYRSGLPKEDVTEWHVQGSDAGIQYLLGKLGEASA